MPLLLSGLRIMMSLFFLSFLHYFKFFQVMHLVKWLSHAGFHFCFIRFAVLWEISLKILVKKFKCCENVTFI